MVLRVFSEEKVLHGKDNFAKLRAGFEIGVSGGGFGERKYVVHNRFQFACGDELHHHVELRLGTHVRAEERKLAAEEETQVHLCVETCGGATGDQAAGRREAGEAVFPSGGADVFEDDVHAALVGDATNFVANFLGFVMDEMVGAEFFGLGEFLIGTCGGYDARAEEFRNLNRRAADAATRSENEDVFARLQLRASDEHVPSGLENERNRRSFFPSEILGIREAVDFRGADKFRAATINHVAEGRGLAAVVVETGKAGRAFAAAYERGEHNFLADANVGYVGANFRDFAGNVTSGNVRKRDLHIGQAAANPKVKMIQRASLYADEDIICTERRLRRVLVFEHVRSPMLTENDCLNATSAVADPNCSIE